MNIKEMVKDKVVRFKFYRDGELVYETQDGFEFPVPISDTGTGIFKAEDKAILFMRWIRKAIEQRQEWYEGCLQAEQDFTCLVGRR